MITKFVCEILLSATLLAATPASADVLVVYTGTVLFGSDETGLFGVGTDLSGYAYTASFIFNPSLGTVFSSPTSNYAAGGEVLGNASPAIYASITINGITQSLGGGNWYRDIRDITMEVLAISIMRRITLTTIPAVHTR